MLSLKEAAMGVALIIFVVGAATASVLTSEPVQPLPDDRPPQVLAEPVEQAATRLDDPSWRGFFSMVYVLLTVALVVFAGLVCAADCCRRLASSYKAKTSTPAQDLKKRCRLGDMLN